MHALEKLTKSLEFFSAASSRARAPEECVFAGFLDIVADLVESSRELFSRLRPAGLSKHHAVLVDLERRTAKLARGAAPSGSRVKEYPREIGIEPVR